VLHEDVPVPEPGEHEVLVKFHAASLNFRDLAITNGEIFCRHHALSSKIVVPSLP